MTTTRPHGERAGTPATRARVAVIGAGVSGLTAAYLLQRTCDVTLYEAEPRLGGHAHTHDVLGAGGASLAVDSGFIVFNERTYPNLVRLFAELGVQTQPSEMSMSVRCDGCGLEYAGARGLGGVFAQPTRAASGAFWRMLIDVKRFHRRARRMLDEQPGSSGGGDAGSLATLREFLADGHFSPYFVQHFMVPVVSCVWSCPPSTALEYPAHYLFRFLDHHGFLTIGNAPQWRTVSGGSRAYVERAAKELTATALATPVRAVDRTLGGVSVRDAAGDVRHFEHAVIATHADEALALLASPTRDEREVLGAFQYSPNRTVLHTDTSLLPRAARARSSWNYLVDRCADGTDGRVQRVKVSYHMNRLQQLDDDRDYLVTLNADEHIPSDAVVATMEYTHPVYTPQSVAAQERLQCLDDDRIAFAGAYHGWGFHEDGCRSGVGAARHFGAAW
ncbi:MAG TPA: FAD-dependent oxidoreductase [Acidimicrobiia bacterium]|nr:FAD-dependent oxidoreductase [Acidimicrobiia bacterium]